MQTNSPNLGSMEDIIATSDTLKPDTTIITQDTSGQIIDTLKEIPIVFTDSTLADTVVHDTTIASPGIGYNSGNEQILIQPKTSYNTTHRVKNYDVIDPKTGVGILLFLSIMLCYFINHIDNGTNTRTIPKLSYPITIISLQLTGGEDLSGATVILRDSYEVVHNITIGREPEDEVLYWSKNLKQILLSSGISEKRFRNIGDNIILNPITIADAIPTTTSETVETTT